MEKQRTIKQNRSLHLFFRLLADELNFSGLDMRKTLKPSIDIPWTDKNIKEFIWKPIQEAMILKKSTTEMNTGDMTKIWEVINKNIGEKFGVEVPLIPSEEQTENYIKSLEKSYGKE
jgi:hypothetical protein